MKGMILNWRYRVLGILAAVSFLLLVGEPAVYGQNWIATFAAVKLSGAVLSAAVIWLYRRWASRGEMGELNEFVKE